MRWRRSATCAWRAHSSFYYKGRNVDLRTIGKSLGVAHVLEGSVRTQGNKVRITAQLIRSADGIHLWSKQYDGDLSDVFKLQDQIARAIADELQLVLDGEQKSAIGGGSDRQPRGLSLCTCARASVLHKRDYARAKTRSPGSNRRSRWIRNSRARNRNSRWCRWW
jgi:hypothetical protein